MKKLKTIMTVMLLMVATMTYAQDTHFAKTVTGANYEQTINTDKLVVIDFWASWCGPCRTIAPIVEELAKEYNGTVVVGKVNVDDEESLSTKFNISSIPTLVFIKNKKIVETVVGVKPKADLKALFDKYK